MYGLRSQRIDNSSCSPAKASTAGVTGTVSWNDDKAIHLTGERKRCVGPIGDSPSSAPKRCRWVRLAAVAACNLGGGLAGRREAHHHAVKPGLGGARLLDRDRDSDGGGATRRSKVRGGPRVTERTAVAGWRSAAAAVETERVAQGARVASAHALGASGRGRSFAHSCRLACAVQTVA